MAAPNPDNVKPLFKDKYYVYALCKPNGDVFYIGKGKNTRINDHFCNYFMNQSNYKNNVIKRYGSSKVRREILCYFDKEESAYEHEEWLISLYGVRNEGGALTNISKSRSDYKGNHLEYAQEAAVKDRRVNVLDHTAVGILYMYYTMCKTVPEIIDRYGYTKKVISKVVKGQKNNNIYTKYLSSGKIKNNRGIRKVFRPNHSARKVSDSDLIKYHERFVTGEINMKEISEILTMSERTLIQIFRGDTRKYLNLSLKDRLFTYNRNVTKAEVESMIKERVLHGTSYVKIAKMFGKTERLTQRACKLEGQYRVFKDYKEELEFEKKYNKKPI